MKYFLFSPLLLFIGLFLSCSSDPIIGTYYEFDIMSDHSISIEANNKCSYTYNGDVGRGTWKYVDDNKSTIMCNWGLSSINGLFKFVNDKDQPYLLDVYKSSIWLKDKGGKSIGLVGNIFIVGFVVLMFYLIIIKPYQKKQRKLIDKENV